MRKTVILFSVLFLFSTHAFCQNGEAKIIYVIDSIPLLDDPTPYNDINKDDFFDISIIKNKDSLSKLGYSGFGAAVFIFTKEYRSRSESVKQIPSTQQMQRVSDQWFLNGKPYVGQFIDYYYSGRKEGEGFLKEGRLDGPRKTFFQNGKVSMERYYKDGIPNGLATEYFEDGSLKQKGQFIDGLEDEIWEMYFPNGQIQQRSTFRRGKMHGETIVFYSNGKILAVENSKNGKTTPDKNLQKIDAALQKGHNSNRMGDYKNAIKHYSNAIALDTSFAESYFARGTAKMNALQFDGAIEDFNRALEIEPYYGEALANRAFSRIRKHQFADGRQFSERDGIKFTASKDNEVIPDGELTLICNDTRKAAFLGDNNGMIMNVLTTYCREETNQ